MIRAAAALLVIALFFLTAPPASAKRAEHLIVPLTGHRVRPIDPETLFHTFFADFYDEHDGTTFVETGDIPAMWLRDSAAQSLPYIRFAPTYQLVRWRLAGVVARNARNVIADPYADAFDEHYHVWEEKWEAGGLAWPFVMAWSFWHSTQERIIFTPELHRALRVAVDTWRCEQLHASCSRYREPVVIGRHGIHYTSERYNPGTGMIWTAFRPSDDPVTYHFNIPQEAFIAIALQDIAQLARDGYDDTNLANEASSIADAVALGIMRYGRVWDAAYGGWMYVYETDGLGHDLYMDDANAPDLTALPYLGWCSAADPAYLNTRAYVLSKRDPWYFQGRYAQGLGSPHTPYGFVWPLGIMARALTATSSLETSDSITTLAETDSEQGLIHESFDPNAYWIYTRAWFGWGNALYAELLFRSVAGFPAVPFTANGQTVMPFERISQTPSITGPLTQVIDASILYGTLGDLLEEAQGQSIISRVRSAIQKAPEKHAAVPWRELQDEPEPVILRNGAPVR